MSLNIEISKDGYKVLQLEMNEKKQYLGSKYNQKREIDKFIGQYDRFTINDTYIVFGLSFGEHIKELLKGIDKESKVLIIEVNDELIKYGEEDKDIKKIIDNPRVILASDAEEVREFFRQCVTQMNINNVKIGYYCNYDKIYKGQLIEIYQMIESESERIISDKETSLFFGEDWFESFLRNIKYMAKATAVNYLEDKYKNKPAVIVSAGPSLSKNIDELKTVDNALIISGGRTLGPLLEKDIEPSCLCVVDAGEVSYKLVEDNIDKVKCPLVFYEATNPKVVEAHKGEKIFSTNSKFIHDVWDEYIITLSGGGSVAHVMTILAAYMGCSPIIFIGQDLAYTDDKGHADIAQNKWQNLTFDNFYKKDDDLYVEDINGNLVRTSKVLNLYRIALEDIIKLFPDTKFINATEGGANIKGAENRKLKDVLEGINSEQVVPITENLIKENKTKELILALESVLKNFDDCVELCGRGQKSLQEFKYNYKLKNQYMLSKSIKELDYIDKRLKQNIDNMYIIDSILFNTMYRIENSEMFLINSADDKETIFKKNTDKNEAIYTGLKEVIEKSYSRVREALEELKVINNE
ncbi:MAG: DUF115 domain-containing protein [Clostridium beijerinckii]|jgi:hypothetical protein|uniref:motility associated factor glycosyltransferase family protein n=1 Tax=Clostridium beijerinckii TaxID=1520 RepID=UPI001494D0B3|nr:6-hydroxymethylpterin diphosphokinase MptE-like protein [Clostridium beijerinckii]MCI1477731.1 DUF115 domain-containing protein [Clostridium beijerinckii]MCI1577953.1 DUF115 domain-containing protein [Clostridium beijerinckii]MCI1583134.1 DUF115 domain-containing protein [Clostridium beijerinckii]MCI1620636.1 DUF115 domain-containing protein [Clostridium beijerinckii]NOW87873.1 hypothetical protein [Clostridium beijerinckii]